MQVLYELGRHFRHVILRLLQEPIVFVLPLGSGFIVTVYQCLFQLMASIFKVSLNFLRVRVPFFVIFVSNVGLKALAARAAIPRRMERWWNE